MKIETKHTLITEELHRRILSGYYQKKLPPLRSLMKEYKVSLQTISKAVKPLSRNGMISPGPRGSVINVASNMRPRYYSYGYLIGSNITYDDFSRLPIYKTLCRNNYNIVLLNTENENLINKPDFWDNLPIDGLVFGYGSLTTEIAWRVAQAGIPAISRHFAGDLPVHVVDFATYPAVDQVVGELTAKGYQRIALQFMDYREGYQDYANKHWDEIRHKHNIEYPEYREVVMAGRIDGRERHTQYLCLKTPPEVILCWHSCVKETYQALTNLGLHKQVKLISIASKWQPEEDYFYALSSQNEESYWEEVLKVLEEIVEQKKQEKIFRLVPLDIKFLRELPDYMK